MAGFTDPNSTPAGTGHDQADALRAEKGDAFEPSKLDPIPRSEAHLQQFPSLVGQPGVEVVERSADLTGGKSAKRHRKVFVIGTYGYDFDEAGFDHGPNFTATRQYMLDHGLRPVGDVSFAGSERVNEANTALSYEVEAQPAAIAVSPETAHTVVSQD